MGKTRLWYIRANKLFAELPEEDMQEMASMLRPVNVRKKDFVYSAGDASDTIYMLKEGRIKITRLTEDGHELTISILEPGDIFGELALAGEDERETSAVALEDSFICAISRQGFERFVSTRPRFSLSITKWMGSRLRNIENRFEDMIFRDVRSRLVSVLEDLAEDYGTDVPSGRKVGIRLTHQELANLIGASRETVTLEINNLKRSGEIIVEDREFILPVKSFS